MSRQAPRMQDPAAGVPPQLLPHMHLVSNYRYPVMSTLSKDTAVEYLLSAPKVVREVQPVHWMFLDGPPDGTVMLVWQPLNHLGTNFASDGYVWADVEQIYTTETRGYNVEVWLHRCGYHPPNEAVATHCRRRYRLMPTNPPNQHVPPADPSLWIVHYSKAPSVDQLPANRIQVVPQVQNILAQRRFLQSQGQLARKDFMLHDRNSWPTINLPPHVGQPSYPPGHPYAGQANRQQAGGFYPQQPGGPMAAAQHKPSRGQRPSTAGGSGGGTDFSLEEEDTTSGDLLDNVTPRDISRMRYRNHHEWMEEIFASPYRMSQIAPVDLGLGRKGELEAVTRDFFHTPTQSGSADSTAPAASGRLEEGKAEELTNTMNRKIADMMAEMETMKESHARKLSQIQKSSVLKDGELKLRDAVADPSDVGSEFWHLEGPLRLNKEEGGAPPVQYDGKPKAKVDDVVREVEEAWGKSVQPIAEMVCVDKGGLQEKAEPPAETEEPGSADVNMGDSSAGPDDGQQGATVQQASEAPTATVSAPPESKMASEGGGDQEQPREMPEAGAAEPNPPQETQERKEESSGDVEMGGMQTEATSAGAGAGDQETEDWVMVNKEETEESGSATGKPSDSKGEDSGEAQGATATSTPGKGIESLTPGANAGMDDGGGGASALLETSNFDELSGFNSAGEALAAYGEQNDGLELGGLDDSAFGDAFHASDGEGGHVHHDTDDIP